MRRLAVALALAGALAPSAHAAKNVEVGIADDRILLSDPERAPAMVASWAALGVDSVRIHARWVAVAPDTDANRPPGGFVATDPDDPGYAWDYLDDAVNLVAAFGLKPVLAVTGSGPLWGVRDPSRHNPRLRPDPKRFAEFATAVAKRYGDRVNRYVLWNEPNQPGWLQPQFLCRRGKCVPAAPHVYRGLVRAARPAIRAADPGAEVLIGALAPRGSDPRSTNKPMRPLTFLRAMGCVDRRYRKVRTGDCRGFRPASADGIAYHPHGVLRGPDVRNPHGDEAAMADLGRLVTALDRVQSHGGLVRPGGGRFPLHLTEFGYQTNPPDPFVGVARSTQARWLVHAAYLAWRHPRVRSLVQYEWEDEPVSAKGSGPRAFAAWQSGLTDSRGRAKPALAAFTNPIWVDRARGSVWGQARPGGAHRVTVQTRKPRSSRWTTVREIQTGADGTFVLRAPAVIGAAWRFAYSMLPPDQSTGSVRITSPSVTVKRKG